MDPEILKRAYEREKARRKQAELTLEEKSRELFLSYERLDRSHRELEKTHADLKQQQAKLVDLLSAHASVTDDLQLAARLQIDLLPDHFCTDTHSALGFFQPAKFVGGDAYDYFMLSHDTFAFYIVDVEGHGTASAMTSFAVHSQLNPKHDGICKRNLKNHPSHEQAVCATVKELNKIFYNVNSSNKYFTMIYGLLDISTGTVTWCQAGHPAPIIVSGEGIFEIGNGGFPVGTFKTSEFTSQNHTLERGERLIVYSDGVVECSSKSNQYFGTENLFKLLDSSRKGNQLQCVSSIKDALIKWNGGEDFADDITILLVDYHRSGTDQ